MIGSIIQNGLHANYRICCQRPLQNGFLNTLFNCREVVLRNCAAYNYLLKYIRFLQITGRLEAHLYVAVLAMSARLFLILAFHIGFLADGLTERHLRFAQLDIYFIASCSSLLTAMTPDAGRPYRRAESGGFHASLTIFRVRSSSHHLLPEPGKSCPRHPCSLP